MINKSSFARCIFKYLQFEIILFYQVHSDNYMKQSHLTSFLVYNYMKERQIAELQTKNKNHQKRLDIKIQYEQYLPQRSSFLHKFADKSQVKQYIQKNKLLKKPNSPKRMYEDRMQKSVPLSLPNSQFLPINYKTIANIEKSVQKGQQKREKLKMLQKSNISQTQNYHFSTFYCNSNAQKEKYFKYKFSENGKFGLAIKSIQNLNKSQHKKSQHKQKLIVQQKKKVQQELNNFNRSDNLNINDDQTREPIIDNKNQIPKKAKMKNFPDKRFTIKKGFLKNSEDSRSLECRIQRMFNFFALNLYSYGCYMKTSQVSQILKITQGKKKGQRYLYYVGKGNNKNLIVSIMKKRWWWVQTEDISQANLVWTQLKIKSVLQNQASMNYSQMQIADPAMYMKKQSSSLLNNKAIQKIFHEKMDPKFHCKLKRQEQIKFLRELKVPNLTHNHYECNYMLGNKKALFHNLSNYYLYLKKSVFEIIPMTFHIEKINSKVWKQFQKECRTDKNVLWIIKPGENSNRGNGIFVEKQITKIKKKIEKTKENQRTYIIQKYVKNLMLFQRRKFDIRTYLLMVNIGGVTKYFWYNEGYLRTSSQIYDVSQTQDLYIHLTNDAIQCKSDKYGKYEQGNKISYHQFQRYLDNNYPQWKLSVDELNEKMKKIACEVVKATYFQIDPSNKQVGFQLFGLDFLVDSNFRPWLLEVNTNPCLELSSSSLERLIPRMLENAFRISLDPIFQPSAQCPRSLTFYIPDNMLQTNRFQLIFDSLYDRDCQWQNFANSIKKIQYQDEDQQFQGDGQIIAIEY